MSFGLIRRRTILFIITLSVFNLFFLITPYCVVAHSPTVIEVTHRPWGGFEVSVYHPVNDTQSHYIESIRIEVDGKHYWTENFTQQGSENHQYYITNVGASKGSIITVTAICNQDGTFTKDFPAVNYGSDTNQKIPGFFGLGILVFLSIITLGFFIKRKIR